MEWITADKPVDYEEAVLFMEKRVEAIYSGRKSELVWLIEHPSMYTAGTSANDNELLDPKFPVHHTGRGGRYTYHGPGQRVAYIMKDLRDDKDIRKYVERLENWVIGALSEFGIKGETREDRIGIWVDDGGKECKIGSIGVRVKRWIAYHGAAINISTDPSDFSGIVPCGISDYGVTSLSKVLGRDVKMEEFDEALKKFIV